MKIVSAHVFSFLAEGNSGRDNQEEYVTSPKPKRQRLGRRIFFY